MAAKTVVGKTYQEIKMLLSRGNYAPVYFLCGEEPYYIDLISNYIEANVIDESLRDFNQHVFYGKDLNADIMQAIFAARQYPMMGDKQVVIVKEAQTIKKWDALEKYLLEPLESTILVICYKYGTPNRRNKPFNSLTKDENVIFFESEKKRDYEMAKWINDFVAELTAEKHLDIHVEPKAVILMAENIGEDLTRVATEINKLILACPPNTKVITPELVERNIGISKDFNVFELEKALISKDVVKANRIVNYFATSKDHPIQKELPILYNFFANLMIYHYLADKSEMAVRNSLKLSSTYFVRDYVAAAKQFNAFKTLRIIDYIREADVRSKGFKNPSATDGDLWKELIFKILH